MPLCITGQWRVLSAFKVARCAQHAHIRDDPCLIVFFIYFYLIASPSQGHWCCGTSVGCGSENYFQLLWFENVHVKNISFHILFPVGCCLFSPLPKKKNVCYECYFTLKCFVVPILSVHLAMNWLLQVIIHAMLEGTKDQNLHKDQEK